MRVTSLLRPTSRYTLRTTSQVIFPRQLWHRCLATETHPGAFNEAAAEAGKTAGEAPGPTPLGKMPATADTFKTEHSQNAGKDLKKKDAESKNKLRFPRSVQALYLQPLRCEAEYGIPSCDLQLRSYSIRNLEFFSDFALRAAYYLKLPAFGPVPLPRITERWTVPRSSFIFKKSQENFERITLRRLIQIRDGNPETVQLWLAFLQKHAYYGIGMKANVWDFAKLGVGKSMDAIADDASKALESKFEHLSQHKNLDTVEKVEEFLARSRFNTDSGKRAEGARRFVEAQFKQEKTLTRKAAVKADS